MIYSVEVLLIVLIIFRSDIKKIRKTYWIPVIFSCKPQEKCLTSLKPIPRNWFLTCSMEHLTYLRYWISSLCIRNHLHSCFIAYNNFITNSRIEPELNKLSRAPHHRNHPRPHHEDMSYKIRSVLIVAWGTNQLGVPSASRGAPATPKPVARFMTHLSN